MQNNNNPRKTKKIEKNKIGLPMKFIFDMFHTQIQDNNNFDGRFRRFNVDPKQKIYCNLPSNF